MLHFKLKPIETVIKTDHKETHSKVA